MQLPPRDRRLSVGFLEHEGARWACFLVTSEDRGGRCQGHFSFRPPDGQTEADEVRTTDIFVEDGEAEVHARARAMGRPMLAALLASALHVRIREQGDAPELRRWMREHVSADARRLAGEGNGAPDGLLDVDALRSLYASYRLDQVVHLIALLRAEDFERAVGRILEGQAVDFSVRDRMQLAMLVVQRIESLLPLPPFEIWAEDFLANRDCYRLYAHTLHREGRLP